MDFKVKLVIITKSPFYINSDISVISLSTLKVAFYFIYIVLFASTAFFLNNILSRFEKCTFNVINHTSFHKGFLVSNNESIKLKWSRYFHVFWTWRHSKFTWTYGILLSTFLSNVLFISLHLSFFTCLHRSVLNILKTHTCDIGYTQCLLALGGFGAVRIALLVAALCGADAADVDLRSFEEGHHEGLFALGAAAAHQPRHPWIHALTCRGRQRDFSAYRDTVHLSFTINYSLLRWIERK